MKQERDYEHGVFKRDIMRPVLPNYSLGSFLGDEDSSSESTLAAKGQGEDIPLVGSGTARGIMASSDNDSENVDDTKSNSGTYNFVDSEPVGKYSMCSESDPGPSGVSTPFAESPGVPVKVWPSGEHGVRALAPCEGKMPLEEGSRV